ncbi:hypothetical protein [Acinetobacter sp. ANC 5502]
MHEVSSFGLSQLSEEKIALSPKALDIFKQHTQSQNISIEVKLSSNELFSLKFNIDDLNSPDRLLTQTVSAMVESLLNQIPAILTVQNKV